MIMVARISYVKDKDSTLVDTLKRTAIKSITWQLIGFVVLTFISYMHTGSISGAASLAGSSMVSGIILFFLHEKLWQKISWGRAVTEKT